jgi:hypothetical protein
MRRFFARAPLCLLLSTGCSLELEGLAQAGAVQPNDAEIVDQDAELDPGRADASAGRDGGSLREDAGGRDAGSTPGGEDARVTEPDAGGPPEPMGYQPPAGTVGSRCTSVMDCAALGPGATCSTSGLYGSATGYCSKPCSSGGPNPCGSGAVCAKVNNESSCQRTCANDSGCRIEDGYWCSHVAVIGLCWKR